MGWKIKVDKSIISDKAVIIMAPHTSMMDFWIGRFAFWKLQVPVRFLIKKELFWFPLGMFLRNMGAIPVDRNKRNNISGTIVNLFNKHKKFYFVITPEGTRKLTYTWKRGFYYIALKAGVPILLAYIDYGKKEGGIGKIFYPCGNFEHDLHEIQKFYLNIKARYPENFNLSSI